MGLRVNSASPSSAGFTNESVVLELVKHNTRTYLTSTVVTALAGSPGAYTGGLTVASVVPTPSAPVNTAVSGSNLASNTTLASAVVTVKDALAEIAAKANVYLGVIALPAYAYAGGGAAADNTVGAVTVATTAAATGVDAALFATTVAGINREIVALTAAVGKVGRATGRSIPKAATGVDYGTSSAIVDTFAANGVAGVSKVDADAVLASWVNAIKILQDNLNTMNGGNNIAPQVTAV